ncbi:MAG: hypothetical protein LLF83_09645 [Methanobacterium sp.]|nr:hypothetical protein [Methanobacterium sp.]
MVDGPSLATDLNCTHSIITRALDVAIEHCNKSLNSGELEESTKKGFIDYVQCFHTVITTHHHLETQMVFPYFKDKISELPVDKLNLEHGKIGKFLFEIDNVIIPDLKSAMLNKSSLKQLYKSLIGLDEIWHPHIKLEEKYFTIEKMDNSIDKDEMINLIEIYRKFSMEHNTPDYLVIPFQFYNLPPSKREIWAQELPDIINQKFIQIEWKNKWLPMVNFFYPDVNNEI